MQISLTKNCLLFLLLRRQTFWAHLASFGQKESSRRVRRGKRGSWPISQVVPGERFCLFTGVCLFRLPVKLQRCNFVAISLQWTNHNDGDSAGRYFTWLLISMDGHISIFGREVQIWPPFEPST